MRAQGRAQRDNGKAVLLYGTLQDITERKRAEEALLEREKEYRTLAGDNIQRLG